MSEHYSDKELIDRLYGIGRRDTHLDECGYCHRRWLQVQERRQEVLALPKVPADLLAAQRRKVYERLERERQGDWGHRLAPALAALSVVVLGLILSRPGPSPQPTLASSDSGFYTEIYSMVESSEPLAAEPIHGLFED